jgi:hypothetical protein
MKTNPEEFIKDEWGRMIREYWEYMLPEDKTTYTLAYNAMMQDQFTEMVMKKLAGVGDEDGVALGSKTQPPSVGALRLNHNTNQYEVWDGHQWIETKQNVAYGQQALRSSTANNDINQYHSYQGVQQQYSAGGAGGDSGLLNNLAKGLGFK